MVGQVNGWWSTGRRAGQKRVGGEELCSIPNCSPLTACARTEDTIWRRKRCFRQGNDISKGPEVRLYVDWLGWLIYSKGICWDLVMCWAQHRPAGHGPCCHGLSGPVGWGGREKDETASRSLNVNCGRILDTFLGKRKKPENKQLPSCHYYCYCQNPLPLKVLVIPSCSFRKQTKLRTVGVPKLGILGASVFFFVLLYIFQTLLLWKSGKLKQ